ncbi:NADP-dependent isocitrate dehydrogenase [Candidatus Aquarickettsia rohweri]|uniref:Isocitrate dehydrogenase [NADP] n=1 Tax=Candidatus Aquarickettsia rohweri TaxID=2602574 RepID=A0A3S0FT51_9RICK|nr:NADP-dependent isocitrate dehydrogenase [Candidatus Aquarickettsia rohweri]MSO14194.1 Isocitrate dehydrogenase [NADP] [Rickettsiales endosymbiont of Trichoplax sp. H2]RST71093.1 NADP-dependent isocitrate dehydrogenase [Candidatus Aquarickettsia rohweri]
MSNNRITVAYGDGIGPEIMESVLKILSYAKTGLEIETIEIGEKVYKKGFSSGISDDVWEVLKRNKILLKAPITTPLGKGYKSLNVTFRRTLELFANIRPSLSYYPYVGKFKNMDVVIVRENEEDLYSGIEYKITPNSTMAMKLLSTSGCEKIIRYAFEYAQANNRNKVTCITKSNIMKITDGYFKEIFEIIASEYPNIKTEHMLVDIASAKLANNPENFDVIVTLNLYGDIISDIASEISGSVGLAGSANIGKEYAMFEAVHGSAPDIAGKNIANPSGLLNSAIMMLKYLGKNEEAKIIHNAWLKTIEDGFHTTDIYNPDKSKKKLSTTEFTQAVINNFNSAPKILTSKFKDSTGKQISIKENLASTEKSELIGTDFFIKTKFNLELIKKLQSINSILKLHMVSSKGLLVWPKALTNPNVDFYRFRFLKSNNIHKISQKDILELHTKINELDLDILSIINLSSYDNKIGFSLAQGE